MKKEVTSRGLKNLHKNLKGEKFKNKISIFFLELRYAWRRAWLGYDDRDVFELWSSFIDRNVVLLKEFRKHFPTQEIRKAVEKQNTAKTEKEADDVTKEFDIEPEVLSHYVQDYKSIDKLIDLLQKSDFDTNQMSYENSEKVKDEAFRLFAELFYGLWY